MMKEYKRGVYMDFAANEAVEFNYCVELAVSEKIKFVNNVMSYVVGTYYYPVLRDTIFDYAIIQYFTDIRFDEDLSIDEIETLLATTNIVDIVKLDMCEGLLDELNEAIDLNIEYKTGLRMNSVENAVVSLIKAVENKVSDMKTSDIAEVAKRLNGKIDNLTTERIVEAYANSDLFQRRIKEAKETEVIQKKKSGNL